MPHNCPCDCHYADSGALICSACLGNHRPGDEADEDENDDAILEQDTCVFNRHPDVRRVVDAHRPFASSSLLATVISFSRMPTSLALIVCVSNARTRSKIGLKC